MLKKIQLRDVSIIVLISLVIVFSSFFTSYAESRSHKATATPPPLEIPSFVPTTIPEFILGRSTPLFAPTDTATITPAQSPTSTETDCEIPAGWITIEITADDSLESLAGDYQTTVTELVLANCLPSDDLEPDSTLYVPEISPSATP